MIGKVLFDLLSKDAAVAALVGTKIFPVMIPQNTQYPAISYETVSTTPLETKGFKKLSDDVSLQINIFSSSYQQNVEIAEAIKSALDYQHLLVNQAIRIHSIQPRNELDGVFDYELNLFHRIISYVIDIDTTT